MSGGALTTPVHEFFWSLEASDNREKLKVRFQALRYEIANEKFAAVNKNM
jgi:hypothetical protein